MKKLLLTFILTFAALPALAAETDSIGITMPDSQGELIETAVNKILMPKIFSGYRHVSRHPRRVKFMDETIMKNAWLALDNSLENDTAVIEEPIYKEPWETPEDSIFADLVEIDTIPSREYLTVAFGDVTPDWLSRAVEAYRWQEDFIYTEMTSKPWNIEYANWDLPERPRLPEEDVSFHGYLKRLNVPEISPEEELPISAETKRINWLHNFNIALQLSQSYISGNWYQGGTSFLSFLGNFLWDVGLNPVYYPKTMFQSTVSYKLAINSTPDDQYHKYQVSQDLFQYNLKAGYKAYHNWYYSFALQFKTQFLRSYPTDSPVRSASFLSPGELNLGIGMTYTKENAAKTVKFSGTISPLSYNLKTCIDPEVDHLQFGIDPNRKTLSEIGSNLEAKFSAKFWGTATYTTRLFFFTDYKSIETDWEHTLNFQFSRLFSTQIYAHLRYDTKADPMISDKWGKLMLKEILSVGLSYTFSTK